MAQAEAADLVSFLRRRISRTNIGIWRIPLNWIGRESEIAFRLGIEALDASSYYRSKLDPRTEFARLSASSIFEMLNSIASAVGSSDCVLVYNFDLLIAGVKEEERQQVWQDLYNRFPNRERAFMIAIPETAIRLLPPDHLLEKWQADSRIV